MRQKSRCIARCWSSIAPTTPSQTWAVFKVLVERESALAYVVPLLWLPESDVLRSQPEDVAFRVYDAGSGTASANVDADVIVSLDMKVVVRVRGLTLAWLTEPLAGRESRHFLGFRKQSTSLVMGNLVSVRDTTGRSVAHLRVSTGRRGHC